MNFFAVSRNTLSLMTLFAAGTLSVSTLWAETIEREQISVSDQDELREALSVPVGTDDKDVPIYRNNADVTLTGNIDVTTTRTADIKDSDGNVTGTATYADNTIEVLADNVKLRGEGHEISSSEIDLDVNGSGDLFFLDGSKTSRSRERPTRRRKPDGFSFWEMPFIRYSTSGPERFLKIAASSPMNTQITVPGAELLFPQEFWMR